MHLPGPSGVTIMSATGFGRFVKGTPLTPSQKNVSLSPPSPMSMTFDLLQCQEQLRGGRAQKNVSLTGEAGADKNEGRGVGEGPLPKKMSV